VSPSRDLFDNFLADFGPGNDSEVSAETSFANASKRVNSKINSPNLSSGITTKCNLQTPKTSSEFDKVISSSAEPEITTSTTSTTTTTTSQPAFNSSVRLDNSIPIFKPPVTDQIVAASQETNTQPGSVFSKTVRRNSFNISNFDKAEGRTFKTSDKINPVLTEQETKINAPLTKVNTQPQQQSLADSETQLNAQITKTNTLLNRSNTDPVQNQSQYPEPTLGDLINQPEKLVDNKHVLPPSSSKITKKKKVTFNKNLPKDGPHKKVKRLVKKQTIAQAAANSTVVRTLTSNYLSCINVEGPIAGLALFDTGAENANLIARKYLTDLEKQGTKVELIPDSTQIFSLNKEMKNHGLVKLALKVNGHQLPEVPFLVVDNLRAYNFIFGLPAIEQLKIVPNIAEGTAKIMEHTIALNKNKQYQRTVPVRTTAEIRLMPGFEYQIPVAPESDECFAAAPNYYHQVIPSGTLKQLQVLKMPAAATKNHLKFVTIANYGNGPIVLRKDALVAHIVTVDTASIVNAVSVQDILNDEKAMDEEMFIPDSLKGRTVDFSEINESLANLPEKLDQIEGGFFNRLTKLIYSFSELFSSDKPSIQTKTQAFVPLQAGTTISSKPCGISRN
jgi:hypothetical protein